MTAIHVAEDVCEKVPHRQYVFTIPKRLRIFFRFDRKLLGPLCRRAWETIVEVYQAILNRDDVIPGMVGGIQTHGELVHYHSHPAERDHRIRWRCHNRWCIHRRRNIYSTPQNLCLEIEYVDCEWVL